MIYKIKKVHLANLNGGHLVSAAHKADTKMAHLIGRPRHQKKMIFGR